MERPNVTSGRCSRRVFMLACPVLPLGLVGAAGVLSVVSADDASAVLAPVAASSEASVIDQAPGNGQAGREPLPPIEGFTSAQRRIADRIVSVFENGTPKLRYDYAEALGDGRGVTAGRAGFTSATRDLLEVVERYVEIRPDSDFVPLLSTLRRRARDWSGSMRGLDELAAIWQASADDQAFRDVQDAVVDRLYYRRALRVAREAGVRTPLSLLVLYDTVIQHGFGERDPDGMPEIVRCARYRAGGTPASGVDEVKWLRELLAHRRGILAHASNAATRSVWAESVPRVDALLSLVDGAHWQLDGPLAIAPWGTRIEIDG